MAKNDYFVIVFKILSYFYNSMKDGKLPNEHDIDEIKLQINRVYMLNVYKNLFDDGFLTGSTVEEDYMGNISLNNFSNVRITTKGVEFLETNHQMKRVYKFLKEIKDWIPGL